MQMIKKIIFLFFILIILPQQTIASCVANENCLGQGLSPDAISNRCSSITTKEVCNSDHCCNWWDITTPAQFNTTEETVTNTTEEETDPEETSPKLIIPDLQIKLPNLVFSDQNKIQTSSDGENTFFYIPWIGEYLAWLYNYSIGIIAVLALIAIIVGGFYWLLAGGNASRVTEAKNWINAAFSGLGLALGSYLILVTINSNLVRFSSIKMMANKKIDIPILEGGSESADNLVDTSNLSADCHDPCVPPSTLVSIKNTIPALDCVASDCRVNFTTYQKLITASSKAAANNYRLKVTSANRSCATQQKLWIQSGKNSSRVARPSCRSPHLSGSAVDITITDKKGANLVNKSYKELYPRNGPYNLGDNDKLTLLKRIMIESGFVRYCREWWHFQVIKAAIPCYDPIK